MNRVTLYKVYDNNNRLREILIPEKYNCHAFSYDELCGGCDECLLSQYEYYENKIVSEKWPEKEADYIKEFIVTKYGMNTWNKFVNYCKYYFLHIKRRFLKNV